MPSTLAPGEAPTAPLRGELRYGLELTRLLVDREFLRPTRQRGPSSVLLVPGFMAGDQSLRVLSGWLRRRGSRTASAGIWLNTDCAERAVALIESRLQRLAERLDHRVVLIGKAAAASWRACRSPKSRSCQHSRDARPPVLSPLSVAPAVLQTVRSVARLGDLGVPWMLSAECGDGACCAAFRDDLGAPMPSTVRRGVGLLAKRRNRLLGGLPRPVRGACRGRIQSLRHVSECGCLPRARTHLDPQEAPWTG